MDLVHGMAVCFLSSSACRKACNVFVSNLYKIVELFKSILSQNVNKLLVKHQVLMKTFPVSYLVPLRNTRNSKLHTIVVNLIRSVVCQMTQYQERFLKLPLMSTIETIKSSELV